MRNQSIKTLLFGILLILFSGFFSMSTSGLAGIGFICMLFGLIAGLVGYFGPDK